MSVLVKICGVTSPDDARLAVSLGADAIGVNLIPSSKRFVDEATARAISQAIRDRVTVVGVVANLAADDARALRERTLVHELQLHGDEDRDVLAALLPYAYKAVRIGNAGDAEAAAGWPGDTLLVDAKVAGHLGGTGRTFDWSLVRSLCAARRVLLAGGLTASNVAEAIGAVAPYGVDVASGVEDDADPRRKDPDKIRAFLHAARTREIEQGGGEAGRS